MSENQNKPLIDEQSVSLIVSKLRGLEIEIKQLRVRSENYERGILILDRIRMVLARDGLLTSADMEGIDASFEKIPMDLRKIEADRKKFISSHPDHYGNK